VAGFQISDRQEVGNPQTDNTCTAGIKSNRILNRVINPFYIVLSCIELFAESEPVRVLCPGIIRVRVIIRVFRVEKYSPNHGYRMIYISTCEKSMNKSIHLCDEGWNSSFNHNVED
jgi:hypothetical protein